MPLIQLVIILVVVGVILWVINSYIPMQSTIKKILNVVRYYYGDCLAIKCFRIHRKTLNDSCWEVKGLKILSME
jgi:hypothetical protein